jgi:hypothetical protein
VLPNSFSAQPGQNVTTSPWTFTYARHPVASGGLSAPHSSQVSGCSLSVSATRPRLVAPPVPTSNGPNASVLRSLRKSRQLPLPESARPWPRSLTRAVWPSHPPPRSHRRARLWILWMPQSRSLRTGLFRRSHAGVCQLCASERGFPVFPHPSPGVGAKGAAGSPWGPRRLPASSFKRGPQTDGSKTTEEPSGGAHGGVVAPSLSPRGIRPATDDGPVDGSAPR